MSTKVHKKILFPIWFLPEAEKDLTKTCYDILCYAAYPIISTLHENTNGEKLQYLGKRNWHFEFKDPDKDFIRAKNLYENAPFRTPAAMVDYGIIKSFANGYSDTNKDIALFLLHSALTSIVQDDTFKNINKNYILSRMSGHAKNVFERSKLTPLVSRYYSSKSFRNLITKLKIEWFVSICSQKSHHGFFVSFELTQKQLEKKVKRNLEQLKISKKNEALSEDPDSFINLDMGYYKFPAEERASMFRKSIDELQITDDQSCIDVFYNLWTEEHPLFKKMLFEMQITFDIKYRLSFWVEMWEKAWRETEDKINLDELRYNYIKSLSSPE